MKSNISNVVAALAALTSLSVLQRKRLLCPGATAAVVAAVAMTFSVGSSRAGGFFSIEGGTASTLDAFFNPVGWNAAANFGINVGTSITIFDSSNASGGGLFVAPRNVNLTFTFEGASTTFTNYSDGSLTFSDPGTLFDNQTTPVGTSVFESYDVGSNPGLVPLSFLSTCISASCSNFGINGGPIDPHLKIAFATEGIDSLIPANTAYAFLDSTGDQGFDDMVVRIDAPNDVQFSTPLPATLPLFATGLGALGLLGWRGKWRAQGAA
jgi:hypothetical protein